MIDRIRRLQERLVQHGWSTAAEVRADDEGTLNLAELGQMLESVALLIEVYDAAREYRGLHARGVYAERLDVALAALEESAR